MSDNNIPLTDEQIAALIVVYGNLATLRDVRDGERVRRGEAEFKPLYFSEKEADDTLKAIPFPMGVRGQAFLTSGGYSYRGYELQIIADVPVLPENHFPTVAAFTRQPEGAGQWVVKLGGGVLHTFSEALAASEFIKAHPTRTMNYLEENYRK